MKAHTCESSIDCAVSRCRPEASFMSSSLEALVNEVLELTARTSDSSAAITALEACRAELARLLPAADDVGTKAADVPTSTTTAVTQLTVATRPDANDQRAVSGSGGSTEATHTAQRHLLFLCHGIGQHDDFGSSEANGTALSWDGTEGTEGYSHAFRRQLESLLETKLQEAPLELSVRGRRLCSARAQWSASPQRSASCSQLGPADHSAPWHLLISGASRRVAFDPTRQDRRAARRVLPGRRGGYPVGHEDERDGRAALHLGREWAGAHACIHILARPHACARGPRTGLAAARHVARQPWPQKATSSRQLRAVTCRYVPFHCRYLYTSPCNGPQAIISTVHQALEARYAEFIAERPGWSGAVSLVSSEQSYRQ